MTKNFNFKMQALVLSKWQSLSLVCSKRNFTNGTIPLYKKKDIHRVDNLPIFDYSRINLNNRRIYVFGATFHGALGLREVLKPTSKGRVNHTPSLFMQRPVRNIFGQFEDLRDIATGHGFTLIAVARKDQNHPALFGCGTNHTSQLGYHAVRSAAPMTQLITPTPIALPVRSERPQIIALGAGRGHSVVSVRGEGLMLMGDNSFGQCGRFIVKNENYFGSTLIHRIQSVGTNTGGERDEVISIAARSDITICVTQKGKVYVFGDNAKGQLGRGKNILKTWDTSQPVGGVIENEVIVKAATNGDSVLVINDKGQMFGWGCNECGTIVPNKISRVFYEPIPIDIMGIGKIIDAAVGSLATHVVTDAGFVYTWGQGPTLGVGPVNTYITKPKLMPPPLFGSNPYNENVLVTNVVSGYSHTVALTSKGDIYTWGVNTHGCLGLGDLPGPTQHFPLKVNLNAAVIKVAAGIDHTVALCKGGF